MLRFFARGALAAVCVLALLAQAAQADPDQTARQADQVLHEVMSIPARSIPETLLAEAQGLAIIPDVIKIGFIAGVRRGHGVVMVRDANGRWGLPQFVVLTGGSVGWQAGVQGTDVVLVFLTRKSVDGLLAGKFTIGADAAAAAGPVGRNAAAATDFRLKAEILSYSRSRGLFAGLALDGSAIEIDGEAQSIFYASAPGQPPTRIPESASRLLSDVTNMTAPATATGVPSPAGEPIAEPMPMPIPGPVVEPAPPLDGVQPTARRVAVPKTDALRQTLAKNASKLQGIVDQQWQQYLALPADVFEPGEPPRVDMLQAALRQYDTVAADAKYRSLTGRGEFQSAHGALRDYVRALTTAPDGQVPLPPPPAR
jgi:SH3 domain-containing YSC84-like protein 1